MIDPKQVRRESLINFLKDNYKKLSKGEILDIAIGYMTAIYMMNGHMHVVATNETLRQFEEGDNNL